MYFDHCQNLNELKSAYKKLAMKHHPDMGGDEATMKAVNAEHDSVFKVLRDMQNEEADRPDSDVRRTYTAKGTPKIKPRLSGPTT